MDCSPPGSSIHGIFPSKNTGVGCLSFSSTSSWPRDGAHISCIGRRVSYPAPPERPVILPLGGRPLGTDGAAYLLHHCTHVGEAVSNITQQVENRSGPTVFFSPWNQCSLILIMSQKMLPNRGVCLYLFVAMVNTQNIIVCSSVFKFRRVCLNQRIFISVQDVSWA